MMFSYYENCITRTIYIFFLNLQVLMGLFMRIYEKKYIEIIRSGRLVGFDLVEMIDWLVEMICTINRIPNPYYLG